MLGITRNDALPVLVTASWGFNFVGTKTVVHELDPFAFALLRTALSAATLAIIFCLINREFTFRRGDLPRLIAIGLIGMTVNQLAFNSGMALTTASNTGLIMATSPIFGLILGVLIDKERVRRRRWVGVIVGLAGTSLIITRGQSALALGPGGFQGDLLILCATFTFAAYSVLARPLMKVYNPLLVSLYAFFFGSPLLIPSGIGPLAAAASSISTTTWLLIAYLVVSNSVLTIFWYRAIHRLGASRTLAFMYLVPFFATLSGMVFLGETVTAVQLAGAAIMLVGVQMARST